MYLIIMGVYLSIVISFCTLFFFFRKHPVLKARKIYFSYLVVVAGLFSNFSFLFFFLKKIESLIENIMKKFWLLINIIIFSPSLSPSSSSFQLVPTSFCFVSACTLNRMGFFAVISPIGLPFSFLSGSLFPSYSDAFFLPSLIAGILLRFCDISIRSHSSNKVFVCLFFFILFDLNQNKKPNKQRWKATQGMNGTLKENGWPALPRGWPSSFPSSSSWHFVAWAST